MEHLIKSKCTTFHPYFVHINSQFCESRSLAFSFCRACRNIFALRFLLFLLERHFLAIPLQIFISCSATLLSFEKIRELNTIFIHYIENHWKNELYTARIADNIAIYTNILERERAVACYCHMIYCSANNYQDNIHCIGAHFLTGYFELSFCRMCVLQPFVYLWVCKRIVFISRCLKQFWKFIFISR